MNKYLYSLLVVTIFAQAAAPGTLDISWAVCQRQGDRDHMEDTYAAITNFRGKGEYFFGVYDGHNGARSAEETAGKIAPSGGRPKSLHKHVEQAYAMTEDQRRGKDPYTYAFENLDKKFQELNEKSGNTAVIAHIKSEKGTSNPVAWIAWTGDSRAIVVRSDGSVSFATEDHKPDRPAEKARIEEAGGTIKIHKEGLFGMVEMARVGGLAMSRSIADAEAKKKAKGIIATPDVSGRKLHDQHQFLVLASDGVWDGLSNEQAAKIVERALTTLSYTPKKKPTTASYVPKAERERIEKLPATHFERVEYEREKKEALQEQTKTSAGNSEKVKRAACALRDAAYDKRKLLGSDNITVLVVEFNWH